MPSAYTILNDVYDSATGALKVSMSTGAAIMVAANNATARQKMSAGPTYTCDGTADNVQIQAAIDALPTTGGVVLLSEGTFVVAASIVPKESTTIRGQGWLSTMLQTASGANCSVIKDPAAGCWWVTIEKLRIHGNKGANTSGHGIEIVNAASNSPFWTMRDLYISDTKQDGIHMDYGYQRYIYNCVITICDGYGIYSGANVDNGTWVDHSGVEANGERNIYIGGGSANKLSFIHSEGGAKGSVYFAGDYNDMSNCFFYSPTIGYTCDYAFVLGGYCNSYRDNVFNYIRQVNLAIVSLESSYSVFAGNRFNACVSDAGTADVILRVFGSQNSLTSNTFRNNVCTYGINLEVNAEQTIVSNNTLYSSPSQSGGTSIRTVADGTIITDNTISTSYLPIEGGAVVTGNRIRLCMLGISGGVIVRNNSGYVTENSGTATITPLAAPEAATAAEGAAGNVDVGTHSWKVTLVNTEGEKTQLGTKSNVVTIATSAKIVDLSSVPTGATGTASRNIYRTVAGDDGDYKLVGSIADNTTTTFEDNVADANLGAVGPASNSTGLVRTVTHGLATTPTRAYAIPTSDPGAANAFWISSKGTTTFKINAKVAVTTATTFDWRAQLGEG